MKCSQKSYSLHILVKMHSLKYSKFLSNSFFQKQRGRKLKIVQTNLVLVEKLTFLLIFLVFIVSAMCSEVQKTKKPLLLLLFLIAEFISKTNKRSRINIVVLLLGKCCGIVPEQICVSILGCIRESAANRSREVILPLHLYWGAQN